MRAKTWWMPCAASLIATMCEAGACGRTGEVMVDSAPAAPRDSRLDQVTDAAIEFASMRPPGSRFATLERKIVVTAPEAVAPLSKSGDVTLLDELVALLGDGSRRWAAFVVLAAMTGRHAQIVDTYATQPDAWRASFGGEAQTEWRAWLDEHRDALVWDDQQGSFVLAPPD
jgi:hypothetical protein